jgi:anti-sigma regulatory factor (Ser/Thr protein kinase)
MLRASGQVLSGDDADEGARSPSLRLWHPPTVAAVATARRMVVGFLSPGIPEPTVRVAVLLTSELVTNAVVHATTPFRLDVGVEGSVIAVAVSDSAVGLASLSNPGCAEEHGRGLQLVEALAARWGSETLVGGKRVWFELCSAPA